MTKEDFFQEYKDGATLRNPLMWLTTLKGEKSMVVLMDAKKIWHQYNIHSYRY